MADWTILRIEDAPDAFGGSYPGEMRFLSSPLGSEQVAVTYRRMPQHTGGKGSHGHYHKTQEELYYVVSGRLQFKLDDEVLELDGGTALRVSGSVARSVWRCAFADHSASVSAGTTAYGPGAATPDRRVYP